MCNLQMLLALSAQAASFPDIPLHAISRSLNIRKTVIAHFPTPYPDELLYSLCARYTDRVQYASSKAIISELFGVTNATASVEITCNLKYLIANLPAGHSHTANSLIDDHTLLPMFTPFLPQERATRVRKEMEGSNGSAVRSCLGLILTTIKPSAWLRFCPLCAEDERKRYRECYWHRLHQADGVEVCPTHCVFLADSYVQRRNPYNLHAYISAERAVAATSPILLDLTDQSHQTLIDIANDIAWLLRQNNLVPGFSSLHAGFSHLLTEAGLATYTVKKRRDKLLERFRSRYSTDLLKALQCEVDDQKRHCWLYRIVNDFKRLKAHHPLRYLLLIGLLKRSAESFLRTCLELPSKAIGGDKPFGSGPWPCLNPVCEYFRKPHLKSYRLTYVKNPGAPYGIFSCSCGFVYSRRGPDASPEDTYRISRVRAYGHVWESFLRQCWRDPAFSLNQIARRLAVNQPTIKFHATRLDLPFPRKGPSSHVQLNHSLRKRLKKAMADKQ